MEHHLCIALMLPWSNLSFSWGITTVAFPLLLTEGRASERTNTLTFQNHTQKPSLQHHFFFHSCMHLLTLTILISYFHIIALLQGGKAKARDSVESIFLIGKTLKYFGAEALWISIKTKKRRKHEWSSILGNKILAMDNVINQFNTS